MTTPQIVAHRGASAGAPENTLVAYAEAVEQGAQAAECDVHLSADGQVVVIHDETVDRTTDGTGAVVSLSLAALRELDAGTWKDPRYAGEPIPTLDELLDAIEGKLVLFLEIKAGGGIDVPIAEAIRSRHREDSIVLLSFDHDVLARTQARLPGVRAMALYDPLVAAYDTTLVDDTLEHGFQAMGLHYEGVSSSVVEYAHEQGLAVYAWTVNDEGEFRRLESIGVDGIITDKPAWGLELAASLPPS